MSEIQSKYWDIKISSFIYVKNGRQQISNFFPLNFHNRFVEDNFFQQKIY